MSSDEASMRERRETPRFQTSFSAELAAGSAVVPATVHDLSLTGCGLEILAPDAGLADRLGATGLLTLPPLTEALQGAILPVRLSNMRWDGERLRYGLRFTKLTPRQTRQLIGLMDAMITA